MADTTIPVPGRRPRPAPTTPSIWATFLAVAAGFVAVVDLAFFALIREIIPPLAVGIVLTGVGLTVLRARPRTGAVVLGVTSLVMLIGSLPFAVDHFAHPDSGIDWFHAVVGVFGRAGVIIAAVGTWRSASEQAGRRMAVATLGLTALVVVVAVVATVTTSGDDRQDSDVVVAITTTAFPDQLTVQTGDVLYVDNQHMFRHTFTVEDTDVDVALPAMQGVRIPIDLVPGTYQLVCDVPGHDAMTGQLIVEPGAGS
jgi:plastocyanin